MSKEDMERLAKALEDMYGKPDTRGPSLEDMVILDEVGQDPLDILVATILSQATSDRNSIKAFKALKKRFGSWEKVRRAEASEIEDTIREGGLASQKAARIKDILNSIAKERGSAILDFLKDWDREEVIRYLTGFKGVGPKTAGCVLLFGLGRQCFPVDTHIHRIMKRLGVAGDKWGPEKTQAQLEAVVPEGLEYDLHVNLIRHGRKTCTARVPRCESCSLLSWCPLGQKEKAP